MVGWVGRLDETSPAWVFVTLSLHRVKSPEEVIEDKTILVGYDVI